MLEDRRTRLALEVAPGSVEVIAEAVMELVNRDVHDLAAACVDEALATRESRPTGWLSVGEVAALLGVHQRTVYRALGTGRLTGSRVGSTWRVRREDVETWLEGGVSRPQLAAPNPASFRSRAGRRAR